MWVFLNPFLYSQSQYTVVSSFININFMFRRTCAVWQGKQGKFVLNIFEQSASLQTSLITTLQPRRTWCRPTKTCLCIVVVRWSMRTVSGMVSVAFQLWAGETQLIFSSHEHFLEHTLNLCLQQIKAMALIHTYHPLWKWDSKKTYLHWSRNRTQTTCFSC